MTWPDADAAMRAYYAARAPEYDAIYAIPERQADLNWLANFVPRQFTGRRVLEVAAGTGHWTHRIAAEAHSIHAIDTSRETLDVLLARESVTNVTVSVGDAYDLGALAGFNAAFAGFWFSHVPRARRRHFCLALDAALEPSSTVVFVDNLISSGRHSDTTVDEFGDGWQTRTLADGSTHRVIKNFPRPDDMWDALDGIASQPVWRELEHFWLFQYTTGGCRA